MSTLSEQFKPGGRVVVTQQIPHGGVVWISRVRGCVVRYEQRKTGSWFAHARDQRLWLDRLIIRKDDGELVICHLDRYTHIEVLGDQTDRREASNRLAVATED